MTEKTFRLTITEELCADCPLNAGFSDWPGGRMPCGDFHPTFCTEMEKEENSDMTKLSPNQIKNMTMDEKFKFCYECYKRDFMEEISFTEYIYSTVIEWADICRENKSFQCHDNFEEYINNLTYSYEYNLIGTPHSLV